MPQPRCNRHNLWFAHSPTPSRDGTRLYVVCSCGQPRQVTRAQWEAEEQRRQASGSRAAMPTP